MAYLILVRHGKSEWNKLGLWTGQTDVALTEEGVEEARRAGNVLLDIPIHQAYVSELQRAKETLRGIVSVRDDKNIPVESHHALNERDYGDYTGKNKWEIKELVGDEVFQRIRRSWDEPIPNGESLEMVYARVLPYYTSEIFPRIQNNLNTLVVAHGNSLRALMKHLEGVADEAVAELEIGTGEVHVYELDHEGKIVTKELRGFNEERV